MDGQTSVCPKCDGKKHLILNLGPSASHYVPCLVCRGVGVVPYASLDPKKEKAKAKELEKKMDQFQERLFK
jgi:hypothetical protein